MAMTEWEIRRDAIGQDGIKILLCDDDPSFLQTLRAGVERVLAKRNAKAAIIASHSPAAISSDQLAVCDMAFLDIDFEWDNCNGIDIARALRQVNHRALIFFVTNYIDYAPSGYEVQAFRYILKRDLDDVLERYILQAIEQFAESQESLCLRNRDETADLPLQQISYLEVMDHCVSIHCKEDHFELNATLSGLEERLSPHGFLRIHKSFLVNMAHIRRFRSRECQLADGTTLSVSEKNYSQQKQKYLLWKGLT